MNAVPAGLLNYFPTDWSAFKQLRFDLYNPGDTVLKITCRNHKRFI